MFTGLVECPGTVHSIVNEADTVWTLKVTPRQSLECRHGDSIAINGVCLTAVGDGNEKDGLLSFHVSGETLAKTALGSLKPGTRVNLERAMRPTDRMGGHIVLGHVDGTGIIRSMIPSDQFVNLEILAPSTLAKYVVVKGSIAIDGTSLTVNDVKDLSEGCLLSFMLIPVTWNTTRFSEMNVGDKVNIETDIIAKHIERLLLPMKQGD